MLLVTDTQQQEAASRRLLRAGQRQRYLASESSFARAAGGVHWFWVGTYGEYDKLVG